MSLLVFCQAVTVLGRYFTATPRYVAADDRLVNVFEDLPLERIVRDALLILERLGVGSEVYHIVAE